MTARDLVMAHGWNATAYQILNPGFEHWFSPEGDAVVGYVRRSGYTLAAGGPVCPLEKLQRVVEQFESFAGRVCYVCAGDRLAELLAATHSAVTIGAQPVWDPRRWDAIVRASRSLRAQINRARNKGLVIERVPAGEAAGSTELRRVLAQWLAARGLPPMRFLVEPDVLKGEMADRVVLAARGTAGIAGFLVASPVAARGGYLIEQVARLPESPNGTSEMMIDAAMRMFAEEGQGWATLGLVALTECGGSGRTQNPYWLRVLMSIARRHANRFYNFQGLERFRSKMKPEGWEQIYAISNERNFSPRALYAVGEAFAGISPWKAISIAIYRAIGRELRKS